MLCPNCGSEMWDNRTTKTNPKAPDYKCRNTDCGKAIWGSPYNARQKATQAPAVKEKVPAEVWERKDRMMAKMSAWKSACDLFQGTGKEKEATKLAEIIYKSIMKENETEEDPFEGELDFNDIQL